ncbi:glutathione S-transferase family protein [Variovorax guangxiensis]|uniref:Glutathione S-transferase family protein n=1 Tax=Variovorax guangxiensis TaxID=1775474 RepID=A0A502DWQ3_9BURK|nr:glutathione S-transferase family protein [Variovorax guangxiensis]TPG24340.1 glutathione S-transferase family protein [Variovorax ginsengisoli]TPG28590.1 glutathione S-transferase family protein [Variovorax guangxiensis]
MLKLYIGNKNYSSWSMRPWVLLKQSVIAFEEVVVRFGDDFSAPGSEFKKTVLALNPAGTVPFLVDGDIVVSDTLAIAEYLAESFPDKLLWPTDKARRAQARSACAEMHGGFRAIRKHCGMNIEADLALQGELLLRDHADVRNELARLVQLWGGLLAQHGGPMLLGDFSIADAYFAPMASRLKTYALPVPSDIAAYVERVHALPSVTAWTDAARTEHDFVVEDEPYRLRS